MNANFAGSLRVSSNTVVVRGGGDVATGAIQKLWRAGFNVLVLGRQVVITAAAKAKGGEQRDR